jgi:hypothetical protein
LLNYNYSDDTAADERLSDEADGNGILTNDAQRLALPLVGLIPASHGGPLDPERIQGPMLYNFFVRNLRIFLVS